MASQLSQPVRPFSRHGPTSRKVIAPQVVSSTGDDRTVRLTQNILVEYTISLGRLLVFIVEVFNDKDVVIADED
ncbi:hypothetical protein [Streptomyces sp. NPDC004533]|uniref:hypothetical protein n=1 Tax=Streptomyces sp. NPDC004533 TaxID=3154278 RepID=UPI0033BBFDAB